jgi:hypothetical protein
MSISESGWLSPRALDPKKYNVLDAVWVLPVQRFNEVVNRLALFACQQVIQRTAHSHPSCLR